MTNLPHESRRQMWGARCLRQSANGTDQNTSVGTSRPYPLVRPPESFKQDILQAGRSHRGRGGAFDCGEEDISYANALYVLFYAYGVC